MNRPDNTSNNSNKTVLKIAADILSELDVRYMSANLDEQIELRDDLDRAMLAYSRARLAILKQSTTCTAKDVENMKALRQKLSRSSSLEQLLDSTVSFIGLLTTRFLL
jgi:hypothetical protein